ncbi:MAG: sodium:proton antiporter NhaD [Thermoanaerobaculia bacterium]|nr:sodium:proton antiporter NhaD [Thermoanaerobaculia bacterium]
MALLIVLVFIAGYTLIALEHPLKIDKAATALLTGVFCWLILVFGVDAMPASASIGADTQGYLKHSLSEHLSNIAEILFFLLGAMTIVELVDVHDGFRVVTDRIKTTNPVKLLWVISWVAFFLSSVLDNMTTAIIMCALLRKMIRKQEDLWFLGGFVIIAANAGGAWSPIGDVTTIMLWIGGQVTTLNIMKNTAFTSFVCLLAPLLVATVVMRRKAGKEEAMTKAEIHKGNGTTPFERNLLFVLGVCGLLFVPIFKTVTHMPPYMGILLVVGVLWYVTEFLHRDKEPETKHGFSVAAMLRRIDSPAILFFLGILLAVAALDASGHLHLMSELLNRTFAGNIYVINTLIGLLSAVVDNVPLVAASMGMYELTEFPPDHDFWNLLAYCAGTGGSILIIGSAAGVASMGILKVDFLWYMKRISIYAAIGYFAGIAVYYLDHLLFL